MLNVLKEKEKYHLNLGEKILFFDIEGVLNQNNELLNHKCLDVLSDIVYETGSKLVIISSIKKFYQKQDDKLDIIEISKKIDTYETSILPYEDCCTIFDPKNPITKPKEKECLFFESKFDYNKLVEDCVNKEECVLISYRDKSEDIF